MLKIISKEKYNELLLENERLKDDLNLLSVQLSESNKNTQRLYSKCKFLSDKLNETEKVVKAFEETKENYVKLLVSDDLEKVTPVIAVKNSMFEKFVVDGYLNDTHEGNKIAMQMALLSVAYEAFSQLMGSFEDRVSE